ncbi:ATPase, F1/V1/A1 complex, alpha/beta subunit [Tanacetum coccineum]
MEQGFLNRPTKPKTKKKDIGDSSSKEAPLLTDLAKKLGTSNAKSIDADRAEDGVADQVVAASNQNELNDVLPTSCVGINIPDVTSVSKTDEGTVATPVSTLMNEEKVLGAHVALPLAVVQEISAKFDHTLYGYFIGSSLAFPIINNYVRNAWAKYGVESTIVRDGFFLFKFSSHEGLIKVLDKGPWFIRSRSLMHNTWSANTKIKKEDCTRIPTLMDSVIVAVPFPNGTGHSLENLDVEYEWRPSQCSKPVLKVSQGETMTTPPAKEDPNLAGDQPSESLVAAMENIPSDTGKSKFIQDDINLSDLQNTMDKLMEEDKVLDINTDDIGNKTSTHTTECSNISQTVQSEAKTQVNGSLWERFTEEASTTNSDSEVEEVYSFDYNKANYVASASGEFTLEDDDLDCYDGYEAQLYDLSDEMQKFCDHYVVRLKSHVRK